MAADRAHASSIAVLGKPSSASSVVIGEPAASRSASVVVVAPPAASLAVLGAPDAAMRSLSASVVALGAPVATDGARRDTAAVDDEDRTPLGTPMMPLVIRGGIVGNSFPNGEGSYAPPEPVKRTPDLRPQVGNDGQPAADVSPGDTSSAPRTSGQVAPRVMARPSSSGGGGAHLSPE